jgi:hypothetical protein
MVGLWSHLENRADKRRLVGTWKQVGSCAKWIRGVIEDTKMYMDVARLLIFDDDISVGLAVLEREPK